MSIDGSDLGRIRGNAVDMGHGRVDSSSTTGEPEKVKDSGGPAPALTNLSGHRLSRSDPENNKLDGTIVKELIKFFDQINKDPASSPNTPSNATLSRRLSYEKGESSTPPASLLRRESTGKESHDVNDIIDKNIEIISTKEVGSDASNTAAADLAKLAEEGNVDACVVFGQFCEKWNEMCQEKLAKNEPLPHCPEVLASAHERDFSLLDKENPEVSQALASIGKLDLYNRLDNAFSRLDNAFSKDSKDPNISKLANLRSILRAGSPNAKDTLAEIKTLKEAMQKDEHGIINIINNLKEDVESSDVPPDIKSAALNKFSTYLSFINDKNAEERWPDIFNQASRITKKMQTGPTEKLSDAREQLQELRANIEKLKSLKSQHDEGYNQLVDMINRKRGELQSANANWKIPSEVTSLMERSKSLTSELNNLKKEILKLTDEITQLKARQSKEKNNTKLASELKIKSESRTKKTQLVTIKSDELKKITENIKMIIDKDPANISITQLKNDIEGLIDQLPRYDNDGKIATEKAKIAQLKTEIDVAENLRSLETVKNLYESVINEFDNIEEFKQAFPDKYAEYQNILDQIQWWNDPMDK